MSLTAQLQPVRELLVSSRYFDGVQLINSVMEDVETALLSGCAESPAGQKLDILRTPEAWLEKMMPHIPEAKRPELAGAYALRADLLCGLGALKRSLVDLGAALMLTPNDQALQAKKNEVEAKLLAPNDQQATGGGKKTPVSIITGFLGSGKTTLLNHILSVQHGKKIAIIENEFGEVGIDDALLNTKSSVTEENIIEMNNGCICCTVRGDLIAGLKKIHKQTAGKGKPLDGILIETTGLADPAPVAQTFFADDFVQGNMSLDGILTVVDAKHISEHLKEEKPEGVVNEAVEQVAFADRILLNKTDLVSPEYLEQVHDEIKSINGTAMIQRCQNAQVDVNFLLGIQAFSLDQVLDNVQSSFLEEEDHGHGDLPVPTGPRPGIGHGGGHGGGAIMAPAPVVENTDDAHGGGHGDGHGSGHGEGAIAKKPKKAGHVHDFRVSSVGILRDEELMRDKLDAFISWLIQEKGKDLYRSKGVLAVRGSPKKFVFHAVHMQFTGKPQDNWADGEKRYCKMVFIGKNLNREELNRKFDECIAA